MSSNTTTTTAPTSEVAVQEEDLITQITTQIQNLLIEWLANTYGFSSEQIDASQPLIAYGVDSVTAVSLVSDVEGWLSLKLPATLAWDYPSIQTLADGLAKKYYQANS